MISRMMVEYIAASISSAIIPQPPGNASIFLMPNGLKMSKNLNNPSETRISHQGVSAGPPHRGSSDMSWPTVSSTHAATGSLPQYFSETPLAHVPAIEKNTIAADVIINAGSPGQQIYNGSQSNMPTIAPHVPGATGRNPAPNDVAIIFGKSGNFSFVIGIGRLDFISFFLFLKLLCELVSAQTLLLRVMPPCGLGQNWANHRN